MQLGEIVTTKEIRLKDGRVQYPSKTGEIVRIESHTEYKVYHIKSIDQNTGRIIISICRLDQIETK